MLGAEALPAPIGTVASTVCRVAVLGPFSVLEGLQGALGCGWANGCLCTGLKEPDWAPEVNEESWGPKETSGLSLHLPAWSSSLSPSPPLQCFAPPTPSLARFSKFPGWGAGRSREFLECLCRAPGGGLATGNCQQSPWRLAAK